MALWNENEVANKSIKEFAIQFLDESDVRIASVDGLVARSGRGTYYVYGLDTVGSGVLHGPLAQSAGSVPEVFSFSPVANVKKMRLYIETNYGSTTAGGISEIGVLGRFVPPAGTVILLR